MKVIYYKERECFEFLSENKDDKKMIKEFCDIKKEDCYYDFNGNIFYNSEIVIRGKIVNKNGSEIKLPEEIA